MLHPKIQTQSKIPASELHRSWRAPEQVWPEEELKEEAKEMKELKEEEKEMKEERWRGSQEFATN